MDRHRLLLEVGERGLEPAVGDGADAAPLRAAVELPALVGDALALVARADIFFVATYVDDGGEGRAVDVSHRGGRPGFVRLEEGALLIPDYAGNLYFNTLGNILVNLRAGLTLLDFENGDMLQMSGYAEILPVIPGNGGSSGSERSWRSRPGKLFWRQAVLPLRWWLVEQSPFLPPLGE